MTPNRPYLLRALNDWILDNQFTPYVVCDADAPGAVVPRQFVENGKIVLNISPSAVRELIIGNDFVAFSARFGGTSMDVTVPVHGVLAIYAKENGQGMVFVDEGQPPPTPDPDGKQKRSDKPALKLVK